MILLLDIGNTHAHLGLSDADAIRKQTNVSTRLLSAKDGLKSLEKFVGSARLEGASLCSVVPKLTPRIRRFVRSAFKTELFELTSDTLTGIEIDYPKPASIGPDRLANALAAKHACGFPSVVVDFGTAVTFDIVNREGNYSGGIIAPGLAAMTSYLHEKTALLPRIRIREIDKVIGKSTEEAMLIGAVHGYRGLVRELIKELKRELRNRSLPVLATGSYASLIASRLSEITTVVPELTLDGLRLAWSMAGRRENLT